MSKIYVIDVRYYIPANDEDELYEIMKEMSYNENYGGYELIEVEEEEEATK